MKYVVNPFDEITGRSRSGFEMPTVASSQFCVLVLRRNSADSNRFGDGRRPRHPYRCRHPLDPLTEAIAIAKVLGEEKPDLVLLGKQSVDDDQGQVGVMLADKLDLHSSASFQRKRASSQTTRRKGSSTKVADGRLESVREVDGGLETVSVSLPAVVTTELRLNVPRYASLPGIMKAKKKPIDVKNLADLGAGEGNIKILKMENPPTRQAGTTVPDVGP